VGVAFDTVTPIAMPAPDTLPASRAPTVDAPSPTWPQRLRADGAERDAALAELHALLVKAARFEVRRRRSMLGERYDSEAEDLVQQSADDALLALLGKLDEFRGESRFTTWAYKFALYEAAVKVRRGAWRGREIQLDEQSWGLLADSRQAPDADVQTSEMLTAVGEAIASELSARQREVLLAVTVQGIPIDVLAERLQSTRGALYKTLHDARGKLRSRLRERGLDHDVRRASQTP
jgi:RNA polymerase sigma-70 factor (ECF subfamily)